MIMVKPSSISPLGYIIDRQYKGGAVIKNKLFSERLSKARNLYRKDLLSHYGCVNAIEFSNEGELLVSGGDDRRVLLWSVSEAIYNKGTPVTLRTQHTSNIFCVAFDSKNSKVFSGGNDDQVIIHDVHTCKRILKLTHEKPVYGLSIHPQNDDILATAGEDGSILLFDIREPHNTVTQCLVRQKTGFHSVMFNPTDAQFLVTANSEEGVALWDCRKPEELVIHYDKNSGKSSGISACFDSTGKRVLALRRRLPPVLYATQLESAICQFYHPSYYNSCTMKTCCFAGDDDEYILSGSDDFNLYMWKIPPNDREWGSSHIVLRGHRSIVNQVRYNKHNNLIASSGVEKMVKLWSSVPVGTWYGSICKEQIDPPRVAYKHEDYVHLVGRGDERISHDYSDQSTVEDTKMLAFFDSLIQREIEGWNSSSENTSSDSESDSHNHRWSRLVSRIFYDDSNTYDYDKYNANRISQLIAKKRSRLAKMAHDKSNSSVQRYHMKEKSRKRKNCSKYKSSAKYHKNNGFSKKSTNKHSTSESDNRSQKNLPENNKRKYRTRQSVRQSLKDNWDSVPSSSYDAPSTSTGITNSNNQVFRVIEQDSDEDIPSNNNCEENSEEQANNFINILPTPLNGTHDLYINVLEMSNNNNVNGNVVTVRNEDFNGTSTSAVSSEPTENRNCQSPSSADDYDYEEGCASHSTEIDSSALRSTSQSVHIGVEIDNFNTAYHNESDSDSDYEYDYHTPVKRRRTVSAPDSGCVLGQSSSSSAYSTRNSRNHQQCSVNGTYSNTLSPEEECKYAKFKKRVSKARLNIMKQIRPDSDSN